MGVDPNQFICEEDNCCKWVTEDVGIECGRSIVLVDVTGSPFAEDPVKLFVWDLGLFVSVASLVVFVVVWTLLFSAVDPVEFSV